MLNIIFGLKLWVAHGKGGLFMFVNHTTRRPASKGELIRFCVSEQA